MNRIILAAMLGGIGTAALGQNAGTNANGVAQTTGGDQGESLQEVTVTGTLIRGEGPVGSQLTTVNNADIVSTGTTNTADLLATVPALNSFNIAPQGGQAEFNSGGSSTPGLHGLPGTATLVLVDGHRLVGDTPLLTVPDPSSIPPDAIDHIEIVADGGSAIYGSDAVAGVINIILKKNYNGSSTTVSYGGASAYNTASIAQTFGKTWDSGSALLAATFENNSDLPNKDRSYYTANLVPFGGTDTRTTYCAPANVQIGATTYAPPNYLPGPAAKCDPNLNADLFDQNRRYALMGNIHQDVGEKVHLFLDVKYTDDLQTEAIAPDSVALTIPNTNPYFVAPAGSTATTETALWNTSNIGSLEDQYRSKSGMLAIGADIDLWHGWRLSTSLDYSWSSSLALNQASSGVNQTLLTAAENGTTTSTALDPYGNGTNPQVAAGILNWPLYFLASQKLYDFNAQVDGSVFTLPGGDVKVAVGVANRHESYDGSNPIGVPGYAGFNDNFETATRAIDSAFGELALPIFGSGNQMTGLRALNISVAGRYDRYTDVGSTSNPKYGVDWTPIDGVKFRASYGTSFHAPQLADLYGIDTRAGYIPNWTFVPPGLPGGSTVDGVYIAGGRTDLKPETAKTASFGVDFAPAALPGFKASATYWTIRFNNEVEIPPTGGNELFVVPGLADRFVTFNINGLTPAQFASVFNGIRLLGVLANTPPPLVQEVIDLRRANIGSTDVNGWDFDFNYHYDTPYGKALFGLSGEYIFEYETNEGPGTSFTNNLTSGNSYQTSDTSAYNVIPWHGRVTAGWQAGPFTSQAALNYTGHYNFGYNNTAGTAAIEWVKQFVTVDWVGTWDFPQSEGLLKNSRVQVNVYNVLNQSPPLVIQAGGYSTESASPLGRLVRVTLNKRF
jgi:iron complex outermembrane receptor protein